jgi:hypothetical protein
MTTPVFSGIDPFTLRTHDIFMSSEFLDPHEFKSIRAYVENYIALTPASRNFEDKSIVVDGVTKKLMGASHYRPYFKHFDLSHLPEYWNQSVNTIEKFAWDTLPKQTHPLVVSLIKKCKALEALQGDWVPYRCVINQLTDGKTLDWHSDGSSFKMVTDAECISCTYYTHAPESGGHLWTSSGYMSPDVEENSLFWFEGSKMYHGVTEVKGKQTRLALTIRFARAKDFLFPADGPLLYPPDSE